MLRLLKLVLLLVIIVGASIGATMYFVTKTGVASVAAEAAAEPAPPPAPIFAELAPFTVTLHGETRNRILYTGVTLRLADPASRKMIEDYMPEVRDRALRVLSSQDLARIQAPNGQQMLAEALQAALSQPFSPLPKGPDIADVLFTAFVVQ